MTWSRRRRWRGCVRRAPRCPYGTCTGRPRSRCAPPGTSCGPVPTRAPNCRWAVRWTTGRCTSWTRSSSPYRRMSSASCTSRAPAWPRATGSARGSAPNASWRARSAPARGFPRPKARGGCTGPATWCAGRPRGSWSSSGGRTRRSRCAGSGSSWARWRRRWPRTRPSARPWSWPVRTAPVNGAWWATWCPTGRRRTRTRSASTSPRCCRTTWSRRPCWCCRPCR